MPAYLQGLKSTLDRLMVALEEIDPAVLRASTLKGLPVDKGTRGRGPSPGRRPSYSVTTPDRKTRPTAAGSSPGQPPRAGSPLVMEQGPAGETSGKPDGVPDSIPEQDGEGGMPPAPQVEGNTIDDEHFFPDLPDLLNQASERLNKVLLVSLPEEPETAGEQRS